MKIPEWVLKLSRRLQERYGDDVGKVLFIAIGLIVIIALFVYMQFTVYSILSK